MLVEEEQEQKIKCRCRWQGHSRRRHLDPDPMPQSASSWGFFPFLVGCDISTCVLLSTMDDSKAVPTYRPCHSNGYPFVPSRHVGLRSAESRCFMLDEAVSANATSLKFGVCSHITLWGHRIGTANALLLLLHILLVCHLLLLLWSNVMRHTTSAPTWHICLWGGDLLVIDIFGRVGVIIGIDAILVVRSWLGRIEAGL